MPTVSSPVLVDSSNSGSLSDLITNDVTPSISFQIPSDVADGTTVTLYIMQGDPLAEVEVGSVEVDAAYLPGAEVTLLHSGSDLTAGTYDYFVRVVEEPMGTAVTTDSAVTSVIIDNIQPNVSGIVAPAVLNEAAVLAGTFDVVITFDSEMDTGAGATPAITFSTPISGATLSGTGWNMDGTVFTATYTLADDGQDVSGITMAVTGAKDLAGNDLTPSTGLGSVQVDTAAPASEAGTPSIAEIADQDVANTGIAVVIDSLSGTDGTTYVLDGTGGVYDHVDIVSDGGTDFNLIIKDTVAARGFFDLEDQTGAIDIAVIATDNGGNTTASTISVTLTNVNDAVQLDSAPEVLDVTLAERADGTGENLTPFSTSGSFAVTDDEIADGHSVSISNATSTAPGGAFLGFLTAGFDNPITGDGAGVVGWDFGIAAPLPEATRASQMAIIDALAVGETIEQTYTVTVSDGSGDNLVETLTITITGTNDAPVISGAAITDALIERADGVMADQQLSTTGTLFVQDTDANDTVTMSVDSAVIVNGTGAGASTLTQVELAAMMQLALGDGTGSPTYSQSVGSLAAPENGTGSAFTWKFEAGTVGASPFDFLGNDETLELTYTLTATDTSGAGDDTDAQTVVITVTGSNDIPTITSLVTASGVIEAGGTANATAGTATVTGGLAAEAGWGDLDHGETATLAIIEGSAGTGAAQAGLTFDSGPGFDEAAITGTYGTLDLTAEGAYRYVLDDMDGDTQALYEGQAASETFNYTIQDTSGVEGNTASNVLNISITGNNDAPVIAVAAGTPDNDVTEAGTGVAGDPSASGSFAVTDVDADNPGDNADNAKLWSITSVNGDDLVMPEQANGMAAVVSGAYGSLSLDSSGNWVYTLDDSDADTQALASGVTMTEIFTVQVADGVGGTSELNVTVTVNGTNDGPVVSVETEDSQAESVGETDSANLMISDTITFSDVDANDSVTLSVTAVSATGTTGSYDMDAAALQSMLTITANSTLATGTGNAGQAATWTFDSTTETFDFLAAGESAVLAFTVTANDGDASNTDVITITVTGTNDQPEIALGAGSAAGGVTETTEAVEGDLTTSGTLDIVDVDLSDIHTVAQTRSSTAWEDGAGATAGTPPVGLDAALDAAFGTAINGTDARQIDWSFTLGDTVADFLAVGEELIVVYDVTVDDQSADGPNTDEASTSAVQQVTVTITGTNDVPAITAGASFTLTEGGDLNVMSQIEADGTLAIIDLDLNDTHTISVTAPAVTWNGVSAEVPALVPTALETALALGTTFTATNIGMDDRQIDWNFALDDAEVDFLGAGESLTLVYDVTVSDGNGGTSGVQQVTITINGTNDAPTVSASNASFDEGDSRVVLEGVDTGAAEADDVTINLLGTGSNTASEIWVTTITNEPDLNDVASISGTTSISVTSTLPAALSGAGYTAADVSAAFDLTDNGAPTFNRNATVFDALDAGDSITIDISYEVTTTSPDGTTTTVDNMISTITINGNNDLPFITDGGGLTATVTEIVDGAGGENEARDLVTGTISFDDIEPADIPNLSVTVMAVQGAAEEGEPPAADLASYIGNLGAGFSAPSGGADGLVFYTFNLNDTALDYLRAEESFTQSYDVSISDGSGGSTTRPIVLTFVGTNDAPVITAEVGDGDDVDKTVVETDTGLMTDGSFTLTDVDLADTVTLTVSDSNMVMNKAGTQVDVSGMLTLATTTLANDATSAQVAWNFNSGSEAFDFLDVSDELVLTYTVTAADDSAVSGQTTQDVIVRITGTNDAPVIENVSATPTVTDTAAADTIADVTGTLVGTDADASATLEYSIDSETIAMGATALAGTYGTLTVNTDGTYTYVADNAAVNALAAGATPTETFTVKVDDGTASDTSVLTIDVIAANDTPIFGDLTADLADTALVSGLADLTGTLGATDVDTGDMLSYVIDGETPSSGETSETYYLDQTDGTVTTTSSGDTIVLGTMTVTTAGGYTFAPNDAGVDALRVGDTAVVVTNLTVTDLSNATAPATHTLTITGAQDAPSFSGGLSGMLSEVNEGPAATATGTAVVADRDRGESVFLAANGLEGTYGTLDITAGGVWTYTLDSTNAVIDALAATETTMDTVTVTSADGTTQAIGLTIQGTNDGPVISVGDGDSIAGAHTETDLGFSLSDTLTLSDVDTNNTVSLSVAGPAALTLEGGGTLAVAAMLTVGVTDGLGGAEASNAFTWTFNSGAEPFDFVANGDDLELVYTITATDSSGTMTTQDVTITITGTNDLPMVAGTLAGSIAEDATMSINGTATVSDPDAGESSFVAILAAAEAGTYGTFTIDAAGAWDYAIDNNLDAVQELAVGQMLTDTITITTADGSTSSVAITITGTNDAPVVDANSVLTNEDVTSLLIDVSGQVTDVDTATGDTLMYSLDDTGTVGSVVLTDAAAGTYTYSANGQFEDLAVGDTATDTFNYVVTDGQNVQRTETVTITIDGANDDPTVSGALMASELEDGSAVVLDLLSGASDVDAGAVLSITGVTFAIDGGSADAMTPAGVSIDASTLTVDPADNAFQDLAAGEDRVIAINYTVNDELTGSVAQSATVTLTGTNDAPSITVSIEDPASADIDETDLGLSADGTLSLVDHDTSDLVTLSVTPPASFTDPNGGTIDPSTMFTASPGLDGTESSGTINWSFNSDSENFDYLDAGGTLVLTYTITATDDDPTTPLNDMQDVVITITGTNDAPTLAAETTVTVVDTAADDTFADLTGTLDGADVDENALLSYSITGSTADVMTGATELVGAFGTLTVQTDGSYGYVVNAAAVQGLGVGETPTDTFAIQVSDGASVATETLTVNITGANDTPELQDVSGLSLVDTVAADDLANLTGSLTVTDRDTDDVADMTFAIDGTTPDVNGDTTLTYYYNTATSALVSAAGTDVIELGTLTVTSDGTYTFDPKAADSLPGTPGIDGLKPGQNPSLVTTLIASDGIASDTATITIDLTGANDTPVVTGTVPSIVDGTVSVSATEQDQANEGMLVTASGTIAFADADSTSIPSLGFTAAAAGYQGTIAFTAPSGTVADGTVGWAFQIDDTLLNALAEGEALGSSPQQYDITISDGAQQVLQSVSISIVGVNDVPLIAGAIDGRALADAAGVTEDSGATAVTTSGTLSVSDEDLIDTVTMSITGASITSSPEGVTVPLLNLSSMMELASGADAITGFGSSVSLGADGAGSDFTWQFTSGTSGASAFDFLADGETLAIEYTLTANDGATLNNTATQTVTITVTGSNDAPVAAADVVTTVAEDLTDAVSIAAASASDADQTDVLSYAITVGNGAGLFEIDSNSGVVRLADGVALDHETAQSHVLTVEITDGNLGSTTQQITVNVSDVDDNITTAPVDTNLAAEAVDENATVGIEIGITASSSDADLTSGDINYSLVGEPANRFEIDSVTGVVTVAAGANLDRENDGASYTVIVLATPNNGAASSTQDFIVTLNDLDDNVTTTPVDVDMATNAVDENAAQGTTVGVTVSSTDADATSGVITYSLSDTAGGRFQIDGSSGEVSVAAGADLNRETDASFDITLLATPANGAASTAETFTIMINDVDEFDVSMPADDDLAANEVSEAETGNVLVGIDASASDDDFSNHAVSFTLTDDAEGRFTINGTTGEVRLMAGASLDFETDETHDITIEATSMDGSTATQTFTINVLDVDDTAPVITSNAAFDVAENSTAVATLTSTDVDSATDATFTILPGADGAAFEIAGNSLQFTAAPDFETTTAGAGGNIYSVMVRATDAAGNNTDQSIAVTVTDVNEAPIAVTLNDQVTTVAENTTIGTGIKVATIAVTDDSLGENSVTLGGIDAPDFTLVDNDGTLELHFVGTSPNFEVASDDSGDGTYNVTVLVEDSTVGSTPDVMASFALIVTDVNEAPVIDTELSDTSGSADEDNTISGTIIAMDVDDSDTQSFTVSTVPANGSVVLTGGAYVYTPSDDFSGDDSFVVTVTDSGGLSDTVTVDVTVLPVNDAPENWTPADYTTIEDTDLSLNGLSVSDVDAGTAAISITLSVSEGTLSATGGTGVTVGDSGTAALTLSGNLTDINAFLNATPPTFSPADNATADVTLTMTTNDGGNTGSGGAMDAIDMLTISITAQDDAPIVADSTATTDEDGTVNINVASLITEVDGEATTVTASVPTAQGTVTVSGTVITFVPADHFNGAAQISYTVTDTAGTLSDDGIIDVTVNAVNDATEIDVTAQTTSAHVESVDDATPTATAVAADVALTDVDALDYDTAVFTASVTSGDVTDLLDLGTSVDVDMGAVSVGGTAIGSVTGQGTATLSVTFNSDALAADVEAVINALSYVTLNDTPAANREIALSLTDGDGLSALGQTVTVDITAMNDSPTPTDDTLSVSEGTFSGAYNVIASGMPDSDPEGQTLTVTQIADVDDSTGTADAGVAVGAASGVITTDWGAEVVLNSSGQLTYNLTSNSARFNELGQGETAIDSFTYTVTDGAASTTATVSVTITGENDGVVAAADTINTSEDAAAAFVGNLLANDTDTDVNDTLEVVSVSSSVTATGLSTADGFQITTVDGIVILLAADGGYTLTAPDSLDAGTAYTANFQYTVRDNGSALSSANVVVQVTGSNDAPTAANVVLTAVDEDTKRVITSAELIAAGANDVDANAALSVTALTITSGSGSLTDNMDGSWTYDPDLNDNSEVTFLYEVSDGALTATASAGLDLLPVNDAPVAVAISGAADENGSAVTVTAMFSDVDVNDSHSFTVDDTATLGSVTNNNDGTFAYNANGAFEALAAGEMATDTFSYTVEDNMGGTSTETATITITGENDAALIAGDLIGGINEAGGVGNSNDPDAAGISGMATSTDVDNNDNIFVAVGPTMSDMAFGTYTVDAGGTWAYTLNNDNVTVEALATGDILTDTFTITAEDLTTQTVSVSINGADDIAFDLMLALNVTETASFGNFFNGQTDADGMVTAGFTSTGDDFVLSFDGFDIDFDTEIELFLNGNSIGFIDAGVNDGLSSYSVDIAAADQVAGQNIITFDQALNDNYIWGVTDILLQKAPEPVDTTLTVGVTETASFGNFFNGQTDADGMVTAGFTSTGDDFVLSFDGFDIDFDTEIELFLNGNSIGFIDAGVNDGLSSYSVDIAAADQVAGQNIITFDQALNDNYIWGVTDILLV